MSKGEDNKKKLFEMMKENPNLPVMIMADNDTMCEEYGYSLMQIIESVERTKIYLYSDRVYTEDDRDELEEEILDDICMDIENENEEIINKRIEKEIGKLEHHECILIYCSN